MKDCHELIKHIIPCKSFVVTGGAVKSEAWCQILADVIGVPLKKSGQFEGSAIGAAILAGIGAGHWKSPEEAMNVVIENEIIPDLNHNRIYEESFEKYRGLYAKLK